MGLLPDIEGLDEASALLEVKRRMSTEALQARLARRDAIEVHGVPIVPVTVDELLEPLDEPFDPRVTDLIVED